MSDWSNDDWGMDTSQTDTNQTSSGWEDEDWGTPTQDTSWDSIPQSNTNWDNEESSNTPVSEEDAYWNNQSQYQEPTQIVSESTRSPIKLGSKMVAVILACAFLVVALVLVIISNTGKNNGTSQTQQPQQTQGSQQQVQQNTGGMVQIPNNIALDYSGEIFSVNAGVRNKVKYKDGKQVVYCLELKANFGSTTEVWNYYCSYSAYSNVKIGDSVYVEYQVPQEDYISIVSVSK